MSEAQELEYYLLKTGSADDRLVIEAKLLLNEDLRDKSVWQKQVYLLVNHYSRKKVKAEIEAVHRKMFSAKKFQTFRQKISSLFKTNP